MHAKEKLYKHLPRPRLNRTKINEVYRRLQNLDPKPRTELNYTNVFTLVVAVALSAQSTDVGVNKAWQENVFIEERFNSRGGVYDWKNDNFNVKFQDRR